MLLAVECDHARVVDYLLTDHHINPNIHNRQQTLVSLTRGREVIKLLIKYGANTKDVYSHYRRIMGNMPAYCKDPLKSRVKIFVIGHGGEGKSTLIEALEHEPRKWTSVVNIFVAPKGIDGVRQRTAGIIPRLFKSRFYGDVLFYDFAGQEAYYSSHAAIIKSAVDTCPPIFILVIGLHRDDNIITHSVSYWLGIITNQCANMEGKAPLIVVGSHADLVEDSIGTDRTKQVISQAVKKYASFHLIDIISMDCRYSNSDRMKLLRRCVGTTRNALRSNLSVSLNSHMFLIYLIEKHSSELAITLEKVQTVLETAIGQKQSKKDKEVLPLIPTTIPSLVEICIQLSDTGHILFLYNEFSPEKSFIIIDKTALLAEINGTMFAPEDFKQHCQLATSTGVVPKSRLIKHFDRFDINMLIKFLSYFELAVPIEDLEVLTLIKQHLSEAGDLATPSDEGYLFCPALIRLEAPPEVFTPKPDASYRYGWILSSVGTSAFFNTRFLIVLILRLALSLGPASVVDPTIPALQCQCIIWKTGMCWSTSKGAEVLLEVVDKKKVVVLVQSNRISSDVLKYQTLVVCKAIEAAREWCPRVDTEELLLSPADVTYPLSITQTTALVSLRSVAQSVVQMYTFVISVNGLEQLPVSDHEVYANLGENILLPLFNQNDPAHTRKISDRFICAISSSWSKNPQIVDIICSVIIPKCAATSQTVASAEKIESALKSWRDNSDGTYRSLRLILDQLSVFAGKNPLVSLLLVCHIV